MSQGEAFSRVVIDQQLRDQGWKIDDGHSIRFEYVLPDGGRADYLLCDRNGRSMAVVEAKRSSIHAPDAAMQARHYAEQADVPLIFLANGEEIFFWDYRQEAHPHRVQTFFSQDDLRRRVAVRNQRTDILSQAEGIVPLQKQAAEKAREITPALFIDMFGDPATNPKGGGHGRWPKLLTFFRGQRRAGR